MQPALPEIIPCLHLGGDLGIRQDLHLLAACAQVPVELVNPALQRLRCLRGGCGLDRALADDLDERPFEIRRIRGRVLDLLLADDELILVPFYIVKTLDLTVEEGVFIIRVLSHLHAFLWTNARQSTSAGPT